MAIDPPYRLDPFRNLINVHWESEEETYGTGEPSYVYQGGGYGFYGSVWVSHNSTGPVFGTCKNPFTGASVVPDPMEALLPYDGYTYFTGGAYWGWGASVGFYFDANRMDYLATIVAPELSGMLTELAAQARQFADYLATLPPEGDPPLAAVRQFSYVTAITHLHQ